MQCLPSSSEIPDSGSHKCPYIPDDVATPNENAYVLLSLCSGNELFLVNNLQASGKYFPSEKSFKPADQWLSELNVAIV